MRVGFAAYLSRARTKGNRGRTPIFALALLQPRTNHGAERRQVESGRCNTLCFPDSTALEELAEVYIVRDALIHSHLWELNVREATRNTRCGDNKFKRRVDEKTRRTKNLGPNVVPTSIDREDALKVFNVIWTALLEFKGKDSSTLASSDHPIRFNGEQMPFSKLRDEIEKSRSWGREKEGTPFWRELQLNGDRGFTPIFSFFGNRT